MNNNKKTNKHEIHTVIWGNILRFQYINNLTKNQIAEAMGVTPRTLQTYDKNPSSITLDKIQHFLSYSGMDVLDLFSC